MQNKLKILAFAGSLRKDSFNKKIIKWACNELEKNGHEVTYIDLADYPLPVYNQDIIEIPEEAIKLEKLMKEHPVWLIASPEYNYSIPGGLKNLIDFVSRAPENQPNLKVFNNKVVGLLSASASNFGGLRCLAALRECLTALGCVVVPSQANIGASYAAFDQDGNLILESNRKLVMNVLSQLDSMAVKLL